MVVISNNEIYSDSGKWLHLKGSDVYGRRFSTLPDVTADDFEEVDNPPSDEDLQRLREKREQLYRELDATDYIALKALEGYDCDTLYPGWREHRRALRDEINRLEGAS